MVAGIEEDDNAGVVAVGAAEVGAAVGIAVVGLAAVVGVAGVVAAAGTAGTVAVRACQYGPVVQVAAQACYPLLAVYVRSD